MQPCVSFIFFVGAYLFVRNQVGPKQIILITYKTLKKLGSKTSEVSSWNLEVSVLSWDPKNHPTVDDHFSIEPSGDLGIPHRETT